MRIALPEVRKEILTVGVFRSGCRPGRAWAKGATHGSLVPQSGRPLPLENAECGTGNGEGKMADDKWRMADDGCEMRSGGCGDGESGDPPPQAPSEEMSQEDRDYIYGPSLERMSRGFTRMGQR